MPTSRLQSVCVVLAAACLFLNSGCSLLKPRTSAPAITAGRSEQPAGLSARLRENSGVRPTQPAAMATPAPVVPAASPATPVTNTTVAAPYKMRNGDTIVIMLRDIPDARSAAPIEDVIDDNGAVNLPHIGRMTAGGKTTSVFEQEVEKKYKDEQIYKFLTVSVVIPQRFIYVTGEVRQSNKYPIQAGMTLSQAVAMAGGVTEFSDPKKVQLIRNGRTTLHSLVEIQKDPSKDILLEAGDQIIVPKSWY